jgi:hypothetical protein
MKQMTADQKTAYEVSDRDVSKRVPAAVKEYWSMFLWPVSDIFYRLRSQAVGLIKQEVSQRSKLTENMQYVDSAVYIRSNNSNMLSLIPDRFSQSRNSHSNLLSSSLEKGNYSENMTTNDLIHLRPSSRKIHVFDASHLEDVDCNNTVILSMCNEEELLKSFGGYAKSENRSVIGSDSGSDNGEQDFKIHVVQIVVLAHHDDDAPDCDAPDSPDRWGRSEDSVSSFVGSRSSKIIGVIVLRLIERDDVKANKSVSPPESKQLMHEGIASRVTNATSALRTDYFPLQSATTLYILSRVCQRMLSPLDVLQRTQQNNYVDTKGKMEHVREQLRETLELNVSLVERLEKKAGGLSRSTKFYNFDDVRSLAQQGK